MLRLCASEWSSLQWSYSTELLKQFCGLLYLCHMKHINNCNKWRNLFDLFAVDFTLAELKSLRVKQRYPFRDQQYNGRLTRLSQALEVFYCHICITNIISIMFTRKILNYHIWGVYRYCIWCQQNCWDIPRDKESSFHEPASQ